MYRPLFEGSDSKTPEADDLVARSLVSGEEDDSAEVEDPDLVCCSRAAYFSFLRCPDIIFSKKF
jgi:hypothetical protein